ncbi:hypothetical protein SH2C18_18660 [Clostridium sediminicola]|uniref:Spo0E family sporulation regulatory protein-aspartic acid phosphatase n=1 Tax=Clostridium sediminicola TaxID=3114879 RepID=UPI0031F1FC8C
MKYKTYEFKINEKRDELNKLIQKNLSNLLIDEVLEVSKVMDHFISRYLFSQNTYKKL